ncbi:50S ribosomal protein L30 [Marinomonas mediterranea]|jgi:LSU ribosomal protein L30P|uniref:Large ribosomal subunit protein uL30 n=1 Tax=Marinomonas mediterranea (strain ATCC 700492 / JCM 21426 / NBRC 103028 / MMB-1) TaxID=717774 RepID=F2JX41_MARM1|nr:50S ribosomal protein L30 [Marinomonas mediterranea]ADZ89560.1 ribosomal protein L30 [Marinomonas mediterranea MMB-1]WCN07654.1 50S ribosomal protein L30 [Marinomonas mediterranea]WCN11755.1 50S ribosomal protein L30 [Marinomonas mediterranea]WCN15803.1 50S ribosomal protein L30 [Marinomonas mediterranea MMB-1]
MANNTITVQLTRSPIGRLPKHRETVRGLGLKKVGQRRELEDTPAVRGMVNKVYYMVKVVGE